jgi:hypothetical protein
MTDKPTIATELKIPDYAGITTADVFPTFFKTTKEDPWASSCPRQTAVDIKDDWAVNKWVFNHLPLDDNQKKDLLAKLTLDQQLEKRKAASTALTDKVKLKRRHVKPTEKDRSKMSVKELTK